MRKRTRTLAILIFSLLSISSMSALSATYNGYTSNESTNSVTGGGLEWKQWDETAGMSVSAALNTYSGAGWRMATQLEMAELFNAFNLGAGDFLFDSDENTAQTSTFLWDESESSNANNFIELFGTTDGPRHRETDPYTVAGALFGGIGECCSLATVKDDWWLEGSGKRVGSANMSVDSYNGSATSAARGVALVQVSSVPIPAAAWLFGSALIGLAGIKRKK